MADQRVNVFNPYGEPENIPGDQLGQAVKVGYKIASPEDVNHFKQEQQFGSGVKNALLAGAAGAARSASLGVSDELLTQLGLVKPETLSGLKEFQPAATVAGEIGGIGLSAGLAPELSPIGIAAKTGEGITEAALPTVSKAVSTVVNPETSPVVHKILSTAGSNAIGSAVEGSLFGLQQAVTEHSLGDPGLNAEKVLSDVGYGALLGGGIGGLIGAGKGAKDAIWGLKKDAEAIPSVAEAREREMGSLEYAARDVDLPEATKLGVIDGLKQLKPNHEEIVDAANLIGAPVLESQVSASKHVQDLDSMLMNSPTPVGIARQQRLAEGYNASSKAVDTALGPASEMTQVETGNAIKKGLIDRFEKENEPFEDLYNEIKKNYQAVPVSDISRQRISKNILDLEGVSLSPSSPESQLARSVSTEIANLNTVDDIKTYRTILRRRTQASPELRYISGQIQEKLQRLEENTILRFVDDEANMAHLAPEVKTRARELINERKATDAKYKTFIETMKEIGENIGKKKVYGPRDFINFLDNLTPEKMAKKLFATDNSEFLGYLKTNFPEQFELLSSFQKNQIRGKALKDGFVSPNNVIREVDKYSPEVKKLLFSDEDIKKLEGARTWMDSLPKNINPSGTAKTVDYHSYYANPVKALMSIGRDKVAQKIITGVVDTTGGADTQKLQTFLKIERTTQKITNAIKSGAKKIFDFGGKTQQVYSGYIGSRLMPTAMIHTPEEYDKKAKFLQEMTNNPSAIYAKLEGSTRDLYDIAPNLSQAMQMNTANAVQFLASKLPVGPSDKPLAAKYVPSKSELALFNRYAEIVHNPFKAFEQIKKGNLTGETIETLHAVYPKLYREMQSHIIEQMTNSIANKKIQRMPYRMKMNLSLFLNQDLDNSLNQQNILNNQVSLKGKSMQADSQEQAMHTTIGGLKGLNKAQDYLTPMQRTTQRDKNS